MPCPYGITCLGQLELPYGHRCQVTVAEIIGDERGSRELVLANGLHRELYKFMRSPMMLAFF
jgi:hypothetical protein